MQKNSFYNPKLIKDSQASYCSHSAGYRSQIVSLSVFARMHQMSQERAKQYLTDMNIPHSISDGGRYKIDIGTGGTSYKEIIKTQAERILYLETLVKNIITLCTNSDNEKSKRADIIAL